MARMAQLQKVETFISRQKLKSNIQTPDEVNLEVDKVRVGIGEENFLNAAIELLYFLYWGEISQMKGELIEE